MNVDKIGGVKKYISFLKILWSSLPRKDRKNGW